jgi:hypothetical protein
MGVADEYAKALLSVFKGPASRHSYRDAERITGILHAKIYAIANGKQSLALADLGETLAKLERLDPQKLAAATWLGRFADEAKMRAQLERHRGGIAMIPLETLLNGLFRVIGFIMPKGGGSVFIWAGAGATVTVGQPQEQQARLWEQQGVIAEAVGDVVAAGGFEKRNGDRAELPLRSAAIARLTSHAQPVALIEDTAGRVSLIPVYEESTLQQAGSLKERAMDFAKLTTAAPYIERLLFNERNGVDAFGIVTLDTERRRVDLFAESPESMTPKSRQPKKRVNWQTIGEKVAKLAEQITDPVNRNQPIPIRHDDNSLSIAMMAFYSKARHGAVHVMIYHDYVGADQEIMVETAHACHKSVCDLVAKDIGRDYAFQAE